MRAGISLHTISKRPRGEKLAAQANSNPRPNIKKTFWLPTVAFLIGLYTTFVMQCLWDWFVAPTFHTGPISYWTMFGIQLLLRFIFDHGGDEQNKQNWKILFTGIDVLVPDEKQGQLKDALDEVTDGMWMELGFMAFGNFWATLSL